MYRNNTVCIDCLRIYHLKLVAIRFCEVFQTLELFDKKLVILENFNTTPVGIGRLIYRSKLEKVAPSAILLVRKDFGIMKN